VGYFDEAQPDGSWHYFGQGTEGDHDVKNPANSKLMQANCSVLLFTTRELTKAEVRSRGNYKKLFTFKGIFHVVGYTNFVPENGTRKGDKLLRFFLAPVVEQMLIVSRLSSK
jgi:5-methylcytosine-specific restriction protein A